MLEIQSLLQDPGTREVSHAAEDLYREVTNTAAAGWEMYSALQLLYTEKLTIQ